MMSAEYWLVLPVITVPRPLAFAWSVSSTHPRAVEPGWLEARALISLSTSADSRPGRQRRTSRGAALTLTRPTTLVAAAAAPPPAPGPAAWTGATVIES